MSIESIVVSNNILSDVEQFTFTLTPEQFQDQKTSHRSIGGFYNAQFSIPFSDKEKAIQWVNLGPGRDVRFYNEKGNLDWEGMIRSVSFDTGIAVIENDLRNMANAVFVRYQPVGGGATVRSTTVEDTLSQSRWGKKTWVLAGGEVNAAVADQRAQNFLDQSFWASPGLKSLDLAGTLVSEVLIKFLCIGYWHTLDWNPYNQTVLVGEIDANSVVAAIAADADVGQYINSTYIETNLTQVTQEYDADRNPTSILDGIASLGDSNNNVWVVGMEANRAFYYRQGAQAKLPTV